MKYSIHFFERAVGGLGVEEVDDRGNEGVAGGEVCQLNPSDPSDLSLEGSKGWMK